MNKTDPTGNAVGFYGLTGTIDFGPVHFPITVGTLYDDRGGAAHFINIPDIQVGLSFSRLKAGGYNLSPLKLGFSGGVSAGLALNTHDVQDMKGWFTNGNFAASDGVGGGVQVFTGDVTKAGTPTGVAASLLVGEGYVVGPSVSFTREGRKVSALSAAITDTMISSNLPILRTAGMKRLLREFDYDWNTQSGGSYKKPYKN